jgi:hypothetical protein
VGVRCGASDNSQVPEAESLYQETTRQRMSKPFTKNVFVGLFAVQYTQDSDH